MALVEDQKTNKCQVYCPDCSTVQILLTASVTNKDCILFYCFIFTQTGWQHDTAVCFLIYLRSPSHACFVELEGHSRDFVTCRAPMETQERWDQKIEEGIGWGCLWKVQCVPVMQPFTALWNGMLSLICNSRGSSPSWRKEKNANFRKKNNMFLIG